MEKDQKVERQTAILYDDEENEDEQMMKDDEVEVPQNGDKHEYAQVNSDKDNGVLNSNPDIGNSHISGKWWFGKSTK